MRLWSTPESVRAAEPSALAMIETLAAIGASVWIGVHFGTWWHVFVGALMAPLLLLRTDLSCKIAWRIAQPVDKWADRWSDVIGGSKLRMAVWILFVCVIGGAAAFLYPGFSLALVIILAIMFGSIAPGWGLVGPIGRVLGAVRGVCASPIKSIRAIPRNWWRAIAALDFARRPELLPLPDDPGWECPDLILKDELGGHTLRAVRSGSRHLAWITAPWIVIIFVVPAVCFRLSLKSTALLWVPLLWALRPVKPAAEAWSAHLKLKATSDINRLVAIFSTLVLSGFVAKYLLFATEHELALRAAAWHGWLGQRLGEFVAALVRPGEFPIWQFASAANSVLALLAFFLVRAWLRRDEVGLPASDARIDRTLGLIFFFRRLFTCYVIVCNGVVVLQLARTLPLPQIGWKLFPWL